MTRLATWNVNSLKVRLPQVLEWLAVNQPDVLCLQETKSQDKDFPLAEINAAGYQALFSGQKTYNGVAILSKRAGTASCVGIPGFQDDQRRVLSATVEDVRVVCVYVPNGQSVGSDKFQYKLNWLEALINWLEGALRQHPKLVLSGDFNIAPENRDVYNPTAWEGSVLCSEPERDAFRRLLALGLKDGFRLFEQAEKSYSWWDYRMNAFQRDRGLRIDHILLSETLATHCTAGMIDKDVRRCERPSDHAPVMVTIL